MATKTKAKGLAGYLLNFNNPKVSNMTLAEVFGKKPVPATQLMKTLWVLIKKYNLKVD